MSSPLSEYEYLPVEEPVKTTSMKRNYPVLSKSNSDLARHYPQNIFVWDVVYENYQTPNGCYCWNLACLRYEDTGMDHRTILDLMLAGF